jgi:hypothetical protein
MVVHEADTRWTVVCPKERQPPLVVHTDGVATSPISSQELEPVSWRNT